MTNPSACHTLIDPRITSIPIRAVTAHGYQGWLAGQAPYVRDWLTSTAFAADNGKIALVPGKNSKLEMAVLGLGTGDDLWISGSLPGQLPPGNYRFEPACELHPDFPTWFAMAWVLGGYKFGRYKHSGDGPLACLAWPNDCDRAFVEHATTATILARDLINTPAADMLPDALEQAVRQVAQAHDAPVTSVIDDELLGQHYPLVHAVGRAGVVAPRVIDLRWGNPNAPKVTLVGKGVCFDSGGLFIKGREGMLLMKKDMGGAATMLGLAHMVMAAKLPIRLRLLISAVENAVTNSSYRPGDVLDSRKGMTVEVTNPDAEGRLVLADALTEATSEKPDLIVDCATLTGHCRVALGPEIPGIFINSENLARQFFESSAIAREEFCRLPLYRPYRSLLDSNVADIKNFAEGNAGALTAALFLQEFVDPETHWMHIDTFAWNATERPGRPIGGEPIGMRALYQLLVSRYGSGP